MDNYSLQYQDDLAEATNTCDVKAEFQSHSCDEITDQSEAHAFLETRVAQLWKKLEETNENLNSCDTILEAYCKVVSEKLNQKICSRCRKQPFANESGGKHSKIVASKTEWPPITLMKEITNIFQNVQNSLYLVDDEVISEDNEVEVQSNYIKYSGDTTAFHNDFYETLRDVLDKMKYLEECLKGLSQMRDYCEPSEKKTSENGIESGLIERDQVIVAELSSDFPQVKDDNNEGTAMECKDEVNSAASDTACIVLFVAVCTTAAEERSKDKQQKREILSIGNNPGYSFGHPVHGFGFANVGHFGLDLSFEHGHGFGYVAPLAPVSIAPLVPHIAVAPIARTLTATAPIHAATIAPIHAPTLSLAAPIAAHVPSSAINAVIAAPISSVVPTPFGFPYPAAVVAHNIPAAVHIGDPITAHIAPILSAPITTVKLDIPKYDHVKPSKH